MFALECRCARHIFRQWQKECCHGNGILWQKWGKNLASRTTSSVFHQFSWNLAEMFALECRCARHIFRQWQKECCHGNGILWQKWGENLASRTTSSVFHQFSWNLAQMVESVLQHGNAIMAKIRSLGSRTTSSVFHQFSWNLAHLPWGVDVQDTFFDSGRKCVAMVTAYYGKNGGEILRRELLPQFFTNSHEIWHRCLPWGVDVQDTFFDSGRKCVAMVTAYYGKNGGEILRRELLPQFFTNSHEIWHRCLPWGVDVQDTFFDSGRNCVAMVTAYYGKNGGKILRRELLPQFFTNFGSLGCRCANTFFDSGRSVLPW